jgi:hypothetical protein
MAKRSLVLWAVVISLFSASITNLMMCADPNGSSFAYMAAGLGILVALTVLAERP